MFRGRQRDTATVVSRGSDAAALTAATDYLLLLQVLITLLLFLSLLGAWDSSELLGCPLLGIVMLRGLLLLLRHYN